MSQPAISVLVPTVRPANLAYWLLPLGAAQCSVPMEVVVVADFACPGVPAGYHGAVIWLQRPRAGTIDACNAAYEASTGEYLFLINDQTIVYPDTLERLYQAARQQPQALYTPHHLPKFGFYYYQRRFAAFPFVARTFLADTLQRPWLFDPVYQSFYGDPDLSMSVHQAGYPIIEVESATIHQNNVDDEAKLHNWHAAIAQDRAVFRSRWDHLGRFRDP